MVKVITYGTYDLLHYGHIRLLERARALGDYLIVGVTAENFDRARGKINVQQSLMERIDAVRATGLADEIIVEEYEGQKIDDIKRYNVDIFTVGSDWVGKFDYLNEYCKVIYLERTQGVSSSELRSEKREVRLGIVGESFIANKIIHESGFVNGLSISRIYTSDRFFLSESIAQSEIITDNYDDLLENCDAVYILSHPNEHFSLIKKALAHKKHVLCESPITINIKDWETLSQIAQEEQCVLMDGIKTAYSLAYYHLILLVKSGRIGDIVSIDATCTSMEDLNKRKSEKMDTAWNSLCSWGPIALLPVFQLLGTEYKHKFMTSRLMDGREDFDEFTNVSFVYDHAVANIKVGKAVKSEGELIISGTKGYIYVPAPWWKTDYFELRYENPTDNKRYFYQLEGEGLRYELVSFLKSIESLKSFSYVEQSISCAVIKLIEDFYNKKDLMLI
ncbi:MAG: adenylyltransferase/cytidyltransferase family protein [Muribaculaceae bacterium]|nr:adenylyltransferase/cytidyltransferase family protein [Muribaculaceae bacterium]